jgi:5-methylcytosine-specific restriction endonuclease McrA
MQTVKVNDRHLAVYGNTGLERGFCKQCQSFALIFDGKLACCGGEMAGRAKDARRMIAAQQKRRKPTIPYQREQLARQEHRCLYCQFHLDGIVCRDGVPHKIRVHWDHVVPYAYSQNNKESNFIASCHVCNGIKGSKMFPTVEDAKTWIAKRRAEKGWE